MDCKILSQLQSTAPSIQKPEVDRVDARAIAAVGTMHSDDRDAGRDAAFRLHSAERIITHWTEKNPLLAQKGYRY
jgi:hypothetical protein